MITHSTPHGGCTPLHQLTVDSLCEFLQECDARLAPVANVLREHNISGREMMSMTANGLQHRGIPLHSAMAVMRFAFRRLQESQALQSATQGLEHMRGLQAG